MGVLQFFGALLYNFAKLIPGFFNGGFESLDFARPLFFRDLVFFDDINAFLVNQVCFSNADARRCRDSFNYDFFSAPFKRCSCV
jgi:hypothetical protein